MQQYCRYALRQKGQDSYRKLKDMSAGVGRCIGSSRYNKTQYYCVTDEMMASP
jgi:hypothetical protein